jgi:hypothetical protein
MPSKVLWFKGLKIALTRTSASGVVGRWPLRRLWAFGP